MRALRSIGSVVIAVVVVAMIAGCGDSGGATERVADARADRSAPPTSTAAGTAASTTSADPPSSQGRSTMTTEPLVPGTALDDCASDSGDPNGPCTLPADEPKACAELGGTVLFTDAEVVDGRPMRGCVKSPGSCIEKIDRDLSGTRCAAGDIFGDIAERTPVALASIDGLSILVTGDRDLTVTAPFGDGGMVVSTMDLTIAGHPVPMVLVTYSDQVQATIRADPGVVDSVVERHPNVIADNPAYAGR